jgi:hypothetical protein
VCFLNYTLVGLQSFGAAWTSLSITYIYCSTLSIKSIYSIACLCRMMLQRQAFQLRRHFSCMQQLSCATVVDRCRHGTLTGEWKRYSTLEQNHQNLSPRHTGRFAPQAFRATLTRKQIESESLWLDKLLLGVGHTYTLRFEKTQLSAEWKKVNHLNFVCCSD